MFPSFTPLTWSNVTLEHFAFPSKPQPFPSHQETKWPGCVINNFNSWFRSKLQQFCSYLVCVNKLHQSNSNYLREKRVHIRVITIHFSFLTCFFSHSEEDFYYHPFYHIGFEGRKVRRRDWKQRRKPQMYRRKSGEVGGWWDNSVAKFLTRTGHIAT